MISSDTFRERRKQLAQSLKGGFIVLSAYDLMQQSADMPHPFRQEANFLYLTGIDRPGWKVVYDGTRDRCWLVRPELSEVEILFGGDVSDEAVLGLSGADEVIKQVDLDAALRQATRRHATVYTIKPPLEKYSFVLNPSLKQLAARLGRIFTSVNDASRELSDLRAIKQPEEIKLIKRAISITADAFAAVRENLEQYRHEHEVEADFWSHFRRSDATHAYSPIVAGGINATVLHYEQNNAKLARRKLLLMDCGASYGGYNADITRTVVIGEPTAAQRKIYQSLLEAERRIVDLITPGLSFRDYQREADGIMKQTLQSLDLLKSLDDESAYRTYFPHAVSHGLGIDVHESLGSSNYFKPGMVLTVEPGIYIKQEQIGIRIEDNILVTERGAQNLSKGISTSLE